MTLNESTADRTIRVFLGVAIATFLLLTQHPWWALVGVIPVATGIWGFCPLYRLLGVSTCHAKTRTT